MLEWNDVRVTSWQEFFEALEPTLDAYRIPPTYVFRGQADASWSLVPSLRRRMRGIQNCAYALEIERLLEDEFKAQASLFPEIGGFWPFLLATPRTELWAYMQHHSCATRLLDWTASAFVAAYFAVDQLPDTDGAVFVVAPAALEQYVQERNPSAIEVRDDELVNPAAPSRVVFTWPQLRSRRAVAQQGHFSVSTKILEAHDQSILEACGAVSAQRPGEIISRKIIIKAGLKLVILQQLRAMNIAPHALFPTLDGLGKSLSDLVTLKVAMAPVAHRT